MSDLQDPGDNEDELVTVIVPAFNEERSIGASLDSVLTQSYRNLQVVLVDNGSTDRTVERIEERRAGDDRVELLHNSRRNIPTSLNLALNQAEGRWLVRVDAHCTVRPDYVRTAVERLREGQWGGVGGRKDGVGVTPAGRAIAVAMASRLGVGNSVYHHGTEPQEVDHLAFGAYPVELLRSLGGWDERLTANEDFELDYRLRGAGHRLLFDPRMVIDWHCRQSIADLFGQYHRYGLGKVDVVRLHPESMHPRHFAPPALVGYFALGLALRRSRLFAAMTVPYVAAVTAESVRLRDRLDTTSERMHLPAAFAAMHLGWGLGFWRGVGRGLRERTSARR